MNIEQIAMICHEGNRALCATHGDYSQEPWKWSTAWQQQSAIEGVRWRLDNLDAPESAQHDAWLVAKTDAGWVYGPVKDEAAKTHPCMVPFDQLPPEQQAKDALFTAIVRGLAQYVA